MSTVACPYCAGPVPGLLAGCYRPECVRLDIAEDVRLDRRIAAADDEDEDEPTEDSLLRYPGDQK